MGMETAIGEPVFSQDGGHWIPSIWATGPFRELHGGAVSGLVVAVMEERARREGWGVPLASSVLILRPAPSAPLETRVEVLRAGGRTAMLESTLWAGDKLIAKGTAAFVQAEPVPELARVAAPPHSAFEDPSAMKLWRSEGEGPAHTTLFNALDIRDDGKGTKWGRLTRPMVPFEAPFASLFALADNGTPYWLSGTEFWPPRWGFPNIDITVHVSRAPAGSWVGVEAASDWRPEGMGLTDSKLHDETGPLGRACQTVVLVPRP